MAGVTKLDREALKKFNQYWEDLYAVVPEARAEAAAEMGRAVKQELDAQIHASALQPDAKGHVSSWQTVRMGSKGGYAAISPQASATSSTWRGRPVTTRQITKWLDRGHGVRKPAAGSAAMWSRSGKAGLNLRTGTRFVTARQFYSATKAKAVNVAKRAADKVLSRIADEVDY